MHRLFLLLVVLGTTVAARADYLELARSAQLKDAPQRDATVLAQLAPPLQLLLLDDMQQDGYYHVRNQATGTDGWVYRTTGRRYTGMPTRPAPVPPSSAPPTADEFVVPSAHAWGQPKKMDHCTTANGLPDPDCTPGDIIKENTEAMICAADFRTNSVRNTTTTPAEKNHVYPMYSTPHPQRNTGSTQMCEIDHLVSLELGGADTMANLWPQCSPGYASWQGPGFRDKDGFENYLWFHVCINRDLSLKDAQIEISTNWRKYWELAGKPECRNRQNCD